MHKLFVNRFTMSTLKITLQITFDGIHHICSAVKQFNYTQ